MFVIGGHRPHHRRCPRWGSNPHWDPFKGPASADWATGAEEASVGIVDRVRARCTTQPSGPSAGTVSFGAALSGLASWSRPASTWARRCSPRRAAGFVAEPIAPATTVPPLRGLSARTAPGRSARRACAGRRRRDLTDGRRGASRTNEAFAAASGGRRSPAPSAANTRWSRSPRRPAAGPPNWATTYPLDWRHHSERYTEKLATPDTAVADLDPMSGARNSAAPSAAALHLSVAVAPAAHASAVASVAPVGDPRPEGAGAAATEAASVTVACRAGLHVLVHLPVVSGSVTGHTQCDIALLPTRPRGATQRSPLTGTAAGAAIAAARAGTAFRGDPATFLPTAFAHAAHPAALTRRTLFLRHGRPLRRTGAMPVTPVLERICHTVTERARRRQFVVASGRPLAAAPRTSSSIAGVSRPVKVFCWLT